MAPMVRVGRAEPSELFARSADGHWRSRGCLCPEAATPTALSVLAEAAPSRREQQRRRLAQRS
jgi:hypothetical protein